MEICVLTPHAAVGPEEELPAMAPGITVRVVRIAGAGTALDEAVELVAEVDAIAYASTSSAYAIGFDDEVAMLARLSRRIGIPVVGTCASAVRALHLLGGQRVALMHPPWFDEELNELGASYFRSQGFEVVSSASAELTSDPDQIETAAVVEWGSNHVPDRAEAVFIGGNGFRAAAAIDALESRTGRPVLESNQVLLWELLAQTSSTLQVRGFGRLFS
jgi:maleate isomerase